ncbi:hypothetical protein MFRU_038g00420 [Monilinia fructicola]|nr:hypothetical protein MFRU_038g00420 [Monilinia fructicola]
MQLQFTIPLALLMLSTTSAVDIKRYEGGVCGEDDQPIQCINALERRCCTFGPSSVATWSVEFQLVAPGNIGNWFKPSSGPWNYCGGYVKNSVIAAESGTICMEAQDITDVDINDGANWRQVTGKTPITKVLQQTGSIISKLNGALLPNPIVKGSRNVHNRNLQHTQREEEPSCIGKHYGTIYGRAQGSNESGFYVLRGSAESHKRWSDVRREYESRVGTYKKEVRGELVRLAGGTYYESLDHVPRWHTETEMERLLSGEFEANEATVATAWEELKNMLNKTEARRVEALALDGLHKIWNSTVSNRSLPELTDRSSADTTLVDEENDGAVTGDSFPWISSRDSAESATSDGELIREAADQSAAEIGDSFPWIVSRDNEDKINERDTPTSTVLSDSFPWITERDYDEEVNEPDAQTSTEFIDSFPWIE